MAITDSRCPPFWQMPFYVGLSYLTLQLLYLCISTKIFLYFCSLFFSVHKGKILLCDLPWQRVSLLCCDFYDVIDLQIAENVLSTSKEKETFGQYCSATFRSL